MSKLEPRRTRALWPRWFLFSDEPPDMEIIEELVRYLDAGFDDWVLIPLSSRKRPRKL